MRSLEREGLVLGDSLSFIDSRDANGRRLEVHVHGRIECSGGVIVQVDKWLEVRQGSAEGLDEVLGRDYSYHCYLKRTPDPLPLVRYDNAHGHGGMHRHLFHPLTGEEIQVDLLDQSTELPTLDQVVREAVALGMRAAQRGAL